MRYENILSKIHLHKIFYTTVKLTNPPALRPVHPKNPFPQPFYTTFGAKGPVNLPL